MKIESGAKFPQFCSQKVTEYMLQSRHKIPGENRDNQKLQTDRLKRDKVHKIGKEKPTKVEEWSLLGYYAVWLL
jgi:hypothetical protein